MKSISKLFLIVAMLGGIGFFTSCSKDNDKPDPHQLKTDNALTVNYKTEAATPLSTTYSNKLITDTKNTFKIKATSVASDNYFFEYKGGTVKFNTPIVGTYKFDAESSEAIIHFIINVSELSTPLPDDELAKQTPYISKVYDYMPAVGQFTNTMPEYKEGDTQEDMNKKALESLYKGASNGMISLGGFGGYVVFGFNHPVINKKDKYDFKINGNAFLGHQQSKDPISPKNGGSCEPGGIMVSYDSNMNGKADDKWYEIAGSSYSTAKNEDFYAYLNSKKLDMNVIPNYQITYYKPTEEKVGDKYIKWDDNQGNSGYRAKNIYHNQTYFPQWIKGNKLTLEGRRLPKNAWDISGTGHYYILYPFKYGYVDNQENTNDDSATDISWAVDENGKKVNLAKISFIKVYTAVNQDNGWLGECSTEVAGAEDLHVLKKDIVSKY